MLAVKIYQNTKKFTCQSKLLQNFSKDFKVPANFLYSFFLLQISMIQSQRCHDTKNMMLAERHVSRAP